MTTSSSTDGLRALVLLGLALAASVLVWRVEPANAAFPGSNGKIVFASDRVTTTNPTGDNEIFAMNPDGTGVIQLTDNTAGDSAPTWSADGMHIAFTSARDGDSDIYTMDTDPATSDATNITNNSSVNDIQPAWSPNGQKIAFQSNRDGDYEIYTMNSDGTNQTRLTKNSAFDFFPNWSPNGKKIAFASNRDGDFEIFTMRADGSRQRNRTKNVVGDFGAPAFSPDGTEIAFVSTRDSNNEIYVMSADGSNQTNITNDAANDADPDWQPV